MIRRTLAIAGAAVLAVGVSGLSGPASADPGITQQAQAQIGEVSANANTGGINPIIGDFIELSETTGSEPFALNGYMLMGCNDVRDFEIVTFGPDHQIQANGLFLVADDTYDNGSGPTRDLGFDPTDNPDLVQAVGGLALVEVATSSVVDSVRWGPEEDVPEACSTFTPAGALPNDLESLNQTSPGTWELESLTPKS